jgi:hypothetical protein
MVALHAAVGREKGFGRGMSKKGRGLPRLGHGDKGDKKSILIRELEERITLFFAGHMKGEVVYC